MFWVNNVAALVLEHVLENANGLTVLAGAVWLYVGLAEISRPVANIVAGAVLMAIGAVPYLWRRRRQRTS